eukprot:scaffold1172_cov144-Skeletonema_menzelii.AAC.1
MVVKIPIKRGKTTSEKAVLESPGTKTTMVTNENETPCRFGATAAKQKKRRANNNSISSNANDVGDNSSISSRSSMNSAPNIDRDVRDGVAINDGKLTTDAAAATAAASTTVLPSEDYSSMTCICSPSDQSREQIDYPYSSPDTLFIGDPLPHQNPHASRSLSFTLPQTAPSPTPSTTSLDWKFSGNMESFFEENDRAAGLSPINNTEKINADGCPLREYQLESFDSADQKLLRGSSHGDGSRTSSSTLKTTNRSAFRMPLPSPSTCAASLPASNSQVATTPLAPPSTSISDIFSPDNNGIKPSYVARRKSGSYQNLFDSSPSAFLNIQPANSFSDLLSTPAPSNEEHPSNIQSTAALPVATNLEGREYEKASHMDVMQAMNYTAESMLQLPTPLGSNLAGHRHFVINGPQKTCTDSSIDRINTDGKDAAFYQFLQMLSPAFEGCTFLLPWLRASETKAKVNVSLYGSFRLNQGTLFTPVTTGPSESDLNTAKRRIQSAICAFGGITNKKKEGEQPVVEKLASSSRQNSKSSIFRSRNSDASNSSSSFASGSKSGVLKRKRKNRSILRREKYEKKLRNQYFENGNRLSWDVQHNLQLTLSGAKTFDEGDNSDDSSTKPSMKTDKDVDSNRPTKYKCTLCGNLKKKHICANQPTILRSIGVNVYPAVNAYTADEPGSFTCALSEMNNFITSSSNGICGVASSEEVARDFTNLPAHIQVTTSKSMKPYLRKSILSGAPKCHQQRGREEEESHNYSTDLIFQPSMEITNDQYLNVESLPTDRDYTYPAVPLTFGQRKSMSDALLSISKSVPELTRACAFILKDARKKNQWDQAVAELMAQVLCILKCSSSKDYSLEGLKQYLLEFGISC